jgi:serine/threonine protein phosphatase PrpC
VSVVMQSDILICANVGDSRAVLGQRDDEYWAAVALSHDHKPENALEQQRI